jgi:hypothetical protein
MKNLRIPKSVCNGSYGMSSWRFRLESAMSLVFNAMQHSVFGSILFLLS